MKCILCGMNEAIPGCEFCASCEAAERAREEEKRHQREMQEQRHRDQMEEEQRQEEKCWEIIQRKGIKEGRKLCYKGHDIEVTLEESLGAGDHIYYSVFRVEDGFEVDSGWTFPDETVDGMLDYLKRMVERRIVDCLSEENE